ncbi:MAG: FHA domain-containing protein [Anaerolineae bacterium]|nr:FHA domain-containing protein [Anaerolineae bacterium]MCX8067355.1 FHA domain-containing protein [Anaerolineae bacterium]MDW7990871.1 FHA domain-containing protein [Anaerolineae bacterium]
MNGIRWVSLLLLLGLVLSLGGTGIAEAQVGAGELSITLVNPAAFPTVEVYFVVRDLDGNPLPSLKASDFSLYENDVPLSTFSVEEVEHPMLIGVVIDSAVSFNVSEGGAPRVEKAREAARWLIGPQFGRLLPDDEVAIYAFQNGAPQRLMDFTYDHQKALDQGLAAVSTAGNQYTALFDLLKRAVEETAVRQGARRRALLVFSDGVDKTSGIEVDRVIQEAVGAHLLIYTVGMGADLAHDRPGSAFLRRLAEETGGRYMWYQPGRSGEKEEMEAFLDHLVAQRRGYRLTYSSAQYQGAPEIRLVVSYGGYTVEDRVTYEVPPLPPRVSVEYPPEGQILEGVVTVRPGISMAQREIERVEFYLDDQLVHTARAAPWTWEWDTREYATSPMEPEVHRLRIVACDIGGLCAEAAVTIGTRLPLPTPTPLPTGAVVNRAQTLFSLMALALSLLALIVAVVLFRRGGTQAVRGVAAEIQRRTRVWRQRTGIFGGAPTSRSRLATLTVLGGPFAEKQFAIEEEVVFLGREEERADLVFYWDDYISRRHAKIAREGEQFYIWDLNSANGTWVNEQRVPRSLSEGLELNEAVPLKDGDIIRLGPDLRLLFQRGAPESPTPPAPKEDREPLPSGRGGTRPLPSSQEPPETPGA